MKKEEKIACKYDGHETSLWRCKKCNAIPYINGMAHGERWIDCDCGRSSGLFKFDNNPVVAFKDAVKAWNKKNKKKKV
jgi:hypothetical protein